MNKKPAGHGDVNIVAVFVPLEMPRIPGLKEGETIRFEGRYDQLDGDYFWDIQTGHVVRGSEIKV